MISELFVCTSYSSIIAARQYRKQELNSLSQDIFKKMLQSKKDSIPPHFVSNNIHFYTINRGNLHFVATSMKDMMPILAIEMLSSIYQTIKDFIGVLTEESIGANSIMVYEILDELIDNGYMQSPSTEKLRPYIHSSRIPTHTNVDALGMVPPSVVGVDRKLASMNVEKQLQEISVNKNEIFLDVIERLSAVVDHTSKVVRINVSGCIKMKNNVSNCQEIKLTLNEDIKVGDQITEAFGGQVKLNSCTFHTNVNTNKFPGILKIPPVAGEVTLMSYQASGSLALRLPFYTQSFVTEINHSKDVLLTVIIRNEVPVNIQALNLSINIPVPVCVSNISNHLTSDNTDEQSAKFLLSEKKIFWTAKCLPGQTEIKAQFQLINQSNTTIDKEHIGPMTLKFEISKFTCSGLRIKSINFNMKDTSSAPKKWIRHLTIGDSYIAHIV